MITGRSNNPPKPYPKAALVTGGAHRLGRAICQRLARENWAVAIHYNSSREAAEELAEEIREAGGLAATVQADLSQEDEVAHVVPAAEVALGPLGCLVNNASVFALDTVDDASRESWDQHLEPNLRAPFVLSQAFAKQLPADHEGTIVNLLDERVWNLTPYFVSYTVSKSALWTLTRTLALALAPRIRVNGIGPGPALPSTYQSDEQFMKTCERLPMKRGTDPEEIALGVSFLLEARAMTGQMIALDGGEHMGWQFADREEVA